MIKKILLGTVFFGLVGILIVGAVLHTLDKTDQTAASQNRQGRGQMAQETGEVTQDSRQGGNQRGAGGSSQDSTGAARNESEDTIQQWVTYEGVVETADDELVTITLADGETVVIEGRTWSFAQEQDFTVTNGDQLFLAGFWEDGNFIVGQITNITTDYTLILREETGRPLWAGRGRRGS